MAVLSDYTDGTITVTNGSVDFTGTDTLWRSAAFREGDTVLLQGFTGVIAGTSDDDPLILSNTTGQFTEAWPGASGTFSYRMRYQPDNARFSAKSTALINLLANGILRGIADIGVEEGKLLIGNVAGLYDLIDKSELGTPDPNGSLGKLAALTLAARQILQTDATGALKAIALAANKAIVTDANGDVTPIDLGTLGRTVLGLATGTSAQYVQGDGTLQPKAGLPVSTATQTALDTKASLSGATFTGAILGTTFTVGGANNGRYYFRNASNISIGEVGVASGSGFGDSIGIVTTTSTGQVAIFTGTAAVRRLTVDAAGAVAVAGTLSKGGGTFLIDHPLDPFNKNLRHGFVEAPRYDLIYRGTVQLVDGRATVDIDAASNMTSGTFAALTGNAVVTSLQNQDGFTRLKPGVINGGSFEIICEEETCTDFVSWVVIAERNDPFVKSDLDPNTDSNGRFMPEFDKEDA
ncbi:MAG: hypothetical protein IH622_22640 [Ochrobactrum anthropi]|uniref:Uncharacterized protein n=1 Tax=Brucella anthropi TaxID=529 RepID=A0A8I0TBC8_BRUAN|nr:hypothetical protein [Brucella anthropi]MBE0563594.1 hypothetical protein [Brucella anthropi]